MGYRGCVLSVAVIGIVLLASVPAPAQAPSATERTWSAPQTPWGDPDLQGTWTNTTTTPLERPSALVGKEFLTEEERAEVDAEAVRNADRPPPPGSTGAYNTFWMERGVVSERSSLIVDPPGGRLPTMTSSARQTQEALRDSRRGPSYPTSYEEPSLMERCITRGLPGTMLPGNYNHNYNILQTPDYVVIHTEMIHDTRIIPIDGRPHMRASIQQWLGDSRGHWEGDTLVVETTNFTDKVYEQRGSLMVWGTGKYMHLVERFTRTNDNTIDYRFTLTDPTTFERPWTAVIPMTALDGQMFEYACHEGNYAVPNMLRGARAQEREGKAK